MINVGDLIQWQSLGVDQFETPRKVIKIEEFLNSQFVFVEDSQVGIPIEQVTLIGKENCGFVSGVWVCNDCNSTFSSWQLQHKRPRTRLSCSDCNGKLTYKESKND